MSEVSKPNYWMFAPGTQASMQPKFVENKIIAIDWANAHLGDLTRFNSRENIDMYLKLMYGTDHNYKNDTLCLFQFCNEMKKGDIVFCKGGHFKLTGICRITSDYYYVDSEDWGHFSKRDDCIIDTYQHRRTVEWLEVSEKTTAKKLPLKALTKLTDDKTIQSYLDLYSVSFVAGSVSALDDTHSYEEKEKHAKSLSLSNLKDIAIKQSSKKPKVSVASVKAIARDPYIAEYARKRANGICQLCGLAAPFNRPDGTPYLESHHIIWLSEGGEDSIDNTVALCPNCHKKMHIVRDENDVNKLIKANVAAGI